MADISRPTGQIPTFPPKAQKESKGLKRLSNMHTKNTEHKDNIYTLEEAFQKLEEACAKDVSVDELKEEATAIACALGTSSDWYIKEALEESNQHYFDTQSEIIKSFIVYSLLKKYGVEAGLLILMELKRRRAAKQKAWEVEKSFYKKLKYESWCGLAIAMAGLMVTAYLHLNF